MGIPEHGATLSCFSGRSPLQSQGAKRSVREGRGTEGQYHQDMHAAPLPTWGGLGVVFKIADQGTV